MSSGSDCDNCKHGSRHYALDTDGNPIPKDWSNFTKVPMELDQNNFWTYFVCAKNTFSITDKCQKYQPKVKTK